MGAPERQGLYDPRNEHDACGVGFVANIKGRKSHEVVRAGLQILVNLDFQRVIQARSAVPLLLDLKIIPLNYGSSIPLLIC